jgi:tetratricopeptide (TPR) repeat protein
VSNRFSGCRADLLSFLLFLPFAVGQEGPETACDLTSSAALRGSAREATQKHQYDQAAHQFQQALAACPNQRAILLELSDAQAHRRDFTESIRTAEQFLKGEPNSVAGRLALANAYFMAQRFPEARAEAELALKLEPGQPTALKLKGNIEYLLGEFEPAKDTFIGLLDHFPNDEEAAYMLGRIYYQEGRIDYAIGQFQRALKINPQSYKAYDNLGLCYQARGETEMAVRHFLTAIKLVEKDHPDYDWAYANLANLLLENGDAPKAFAAASKAADRNPYSARNFYLGGKALFQLQKMDLSVNWLERSVSLDANYPEPLYLLARVYGQLGQEQKAKQALEKFREVKAKAPVIRR